MIKEPLLFLCHRIPFPPHKGDKIATFNLLKFLSRQFDVHLGSFIDDPFDHQYVKSLKNYCSSSYFSDISGRPLCISGLRAMLSGTAVSVEHYRSKQFQQWVDETIEGCGIEKIFVYSSAMAQFVNQKNYADKLRVLDMTDVDSDKWLQYAKKKPWYSSWIFAREHRILAGFELEILAGFDAVTLVTDDEANFFKAKAPEALRCKIHTLSNGVDTEYFNPEEEFSPAGNFDLKNPAICFTGAMDYWANIDAVVWFCREVWTSVIKHHPDCHFYIVGGNPAKKVEQLQEYKGVIVTGRVPDVRPYLAAANLAVVPMRIARGIQNKVIEAMAMGKPVVMTSMGQEGIKVSREQMELVHDDPIEMANSINILLSEKKSFCDHNRQWVIENYSWEGALEKLLNLLSRAN